MSATIGEQFSKSTAAARQEKGRSGPEFNLPDADVKTLMTTSAGYVPPSLRDGTVIDSASRTPTLLDRVLATPTKQAIQYAYMEETTYTNNAAEVAEGGTYGEAALAFTPRTLPFGKIVVWLPVTDEQLEDVDGLGEHVDQRLGLMLRQRLELQMVIGDGAAPNIRGILNTVGIQTQAKGADTAAVAIRKAKTKVQTPGYGTPDLVVIHPTNSEALDLAAAADALAPFKVTNAVWNVPRQETEATTLGTALVGDFTNYTALRISKGITMQVTNSHSTFFVEGKQAIRADIRVAFPVYRPAAFVAVTGL
jgi:hypothetical protein